MSNKLLVLLAGVATAFAVSLWGISGRHSSAKPASRNEQLVARDRLLAAQARTNSHEDGEGMELSAAKTDYRDSSISLHDRLSKVTTYSDRAELTRVGTVKLGAGLHWLEFSEIVAGFFPTTVRIQSGEHFSGKILQVVGEEVFSRGILKVETRTQVHLLRELYAQLLSLAQREGAVGRQLTFIQQLRLETPFQRTPASTIYRPFSANVDELRSSIDEIRAKSSDLLKRDEELKTEIAALRERIAKTQAELKARSNASDQDWKTRFFVLVDSKTAQNATFEIKYQAPSALWRPIYDVRAELDRKNGTANIRLVTAGMIEQKTAEDWKQIELTLSTLDPVSLYLPKMNRWILKESRTEAPRQMSEKARSVGFASSMLDQVTAKVSGKIADNKMADKDEGIAKRKMNVEKKQLMKSLAVNAPAVALVREERDTSRFDQLKETQKTEVVSDNEHSGVVGAHAQGGPTGSFTLDPLESLYPELATYTHAVDEADRTQKIQFLDSKLAATSAPEKINYSDSTLPAVQAGGRLIEFTSQFPVDVGTDQAALKVPVHTQTLEGKLTYYTVPKMDTRVFLRAQTTNTTDRPILGGSAQVYMDGDLVSKTRLSTVSEKSYFTVDLGVDRNVETKRIVTRNAKTSGLIKSTHTTEVEVKIELANHHPFPIEMEVKDHYPRSPMNKIEATLKKVEPEVSDQEKNQGVITWKVTMPPKSTQTVSFVYEVSHPDNYLISEFN